MRSTTKISPLVSSVPTKCPLRATQMSSTAAAPAPSLFELEDEDEVVDVVGSGEATEAPPAKRARGDDLLQTPQVTMDQTNPLVFSLKK